MPTNFVKSHFYKFLLKSLLENTFDSYSLSDITTHLWQPTSENLENWFLFPHSLFTQNRRSTRRIPQRALPLNSEANFSSSSLIAFICLILPSSSPTTVLLSSRFSAFLPLPPPFPYLLKTDNFGQFTLHGLGNALTAACQILSFHLFSSGRKSLSERLDL